MKMLQYVHLGPGVVTPLDVVVSNPKGSELRVRLPEVKAMCDEAKLLMAAGDVAMEPGWFLGVLNRANVNTRRRRCWHQRVLLTRVNPWPPLSS